MMNNPWENIEIGCYKRANRNVDLYYAKDFDDKYLLIIDIETLDKSINIDLKGFELFIDDHSSPNKLNLRLKDNRNWEIFMQLCNDLIICLERSNKNKTETIIKRLSLWQSLLSGENNNFPIEKQIGLMGELVFLNEFLSDIVSLEQAIVAWVGPDRDKQDFRINNINIEIKSFLDNKANKITISSLEQLNPLTGELYLYTIGLKYSDMGKSLKEYCLDIVNRIRIECPNQINYFNTLLLDYGFDIHCNYNNLKEFDILEQKCWYVDETFPKIPLSIKQDAIFNIKYQLDLSYCSNFNIENHILANKIKG